MITGKASEFTDKFIAVEEYRNFTYKEGTTIAEYANQLYLLDKKILQVGAIHLPARDQVYMVIVKLKEQSYGILVENEQRRFRNKLR